ncbi:MAG: hypothetical protein ACYSU0_05385 [Planctomycetota bacterium]|jgi:polynucleotide 5'-kinase involved in rRNA processing
MKQSKSVEMIRAIRAEMYEEEKRMGREEFRRRQRERVREFLKGKRIRFVQPAEAEPKE